MYELAKVGGFLLSPLSVVLALGVVALALALAGRRRAAAIAGLVAFALLWLASMPITAVVLARELESRYPALTVDATPSADAIVVLGGALEGAYPPQRPTFNLGPAAGRVWHAAALYRAGKARTIIVAAGNRSNDHELQPEAQAIGQMLEVLGVPREALRLEGTSRNTRENARHALGIARALHVRSVLLVTSAMHMDRARRTFERAWSADGIRIVPAATDYWVAGPADSWDLWLPTASGLAFVTAAAKEFAGIAVLDIM